MPTATMERIIPTRSRSRRLRGRTPAVERGIGVATAIVQSAPAIAKGAPPGAHLNFVWLTWMIAVGIGNFSRSIGNFSRQPPAEVRHAPENHAVAVLARALLRGGAAID